MIKQVNLDQELIEINTNLTALEIQKERQAKARSDVKQFWRNQIDETTQQKAKEKDVADVLKKQVAV